LFVHTKFDVILSDIFLNFDTSSHLKLLVYNFTVLNWNVNTTTVHRYIKFSFKLWRKIVKISIFHYITAHNCLQVFTFHCNTLQFKNYFHLWTASVYIFWHIEFFQISLSILTVKNTAARHFVFHFFRKCIHLTFLFFVFRDN
jgi:hypothetical protein